MELFLNFLLAVGIMVMLAVAWVMCLFVYYFVKFTKQRKDTKDIDLLADVTLIYVEIVNGMFFAYDKLTHRFVCQAQSVEELLVKACELNPNRYVIVSKKDLTDDE